MNKEFYVKHLLNEIKKYATCAKSYKAENEALREKIMFMTTKMTIKDQKIEEFTKLLHKNECTMENTVRKGFVAFEVFLYF